MAAECARADIRDERRVWTAQRQPRMREQPHRLVFLDETFVNTKMARLRGRSRRGERLRATAPFGRWGTHTFIAALRCHELSAPWVVDGPITRRVFEAYIEAQLAPTAAVPARVPELNPVGSSYVRTGYPTGSSRPTAADLSLIQRPCPAAEIACQTRLGLAGMSRCAIPNDLRALHTALIPAAKAPTVPASPTPFTPSGFTLVGTSVVTQLKVASSDASGSP